MLGGYRWAREARKLFGEAEDMLNEFIRDKPVKLHAIVGLYPANSVGDDVEVYTDETRTEVRATLFGLRQQTEKETKTEPCATPFLYLLSVARTHDFALHAVLPSRVHTVQMRAFLLLELRLQQHLRMRDSCQQRRSVPLCAGTSASRTLSRRRAAASRTTSACLSTPRASG